MLTVLFATHNGAIIVPPMLEALVQTEQPAERKIIAVETATTHNSGKILEAFQSRPPLRCFQQPGRAKHCALNMLLKNALGDLAILTDGCVISEKGWLASFLQCASDRHIIREYHSELDWVIGRACSIARGKWIQEFKSACSIQS